MGESSASYLKRSPQDFSLSRAVPDIPVYADRLRVIVVSFQDAGAGRPPPALLESVGSGQGAREAWRQFVYGLVQPLAALVAGELSRKLEQPVTLNFTGLHAHDLTGAPRRSRSSPRVACRRRMPSSWRACWTYKERRTRGLSLCLLIILV